MIFNAQMMLFDIIRIFHSGLSSVSIICTSNQFSHTYKLSVEYFRMLTVLFPNLVLILFIALII